jgi:predicted dehydrogenase
MNLALNLPTPIQGHYIVAANRLRGISLVAEGEEFDAIVTNKVEVAQVAAQQKQHVLLHTREESDISSVNDVQQEQGGIFMPAHPWRFRPDVQAVIRNLDTGNLGVPGLVRIHRWSTDHITSIDPSTILPEIDLILWVFGKPHETAYVVGRGKDFLQVHLGFADNGMALVDYAWGVPAKYDSFTLIGGDGAAYADDHHNMNLLITDSPIQAIKTGQGTHHIYGLLKEFVTAITEDRAPGVTAKDALLALKTSQSAIDCIIPVKASR